MRPAWERFEDHVQDLLGLDSTVASGAHWHDISDGVDRDRYGSQFQLMVDAKATERGSYSVGKKAMRQWREKAESLGKRFVLPIRFVNDNGMHEDYAVLTLDDLAELIAMAKEAEQ